MNTEPGYKLNCLYTMYLHLTTKHTEDKLKAICTDPPLI